MIEIKLVKRKKCCQRSYLQGYQAGVKWAREVIDRHYDALAEQGETLKISVKDVKHG